MAHPELVSQTIHDSSISATVVSPAIAVEYCLTLALIIVSFAQAPASSSAGATTAGTTTLIYPEAIPVIVVDPRLVDPQRTSTALVPTAN